MATRILVFLLVGKVGALQHGGGLLLKQFVQGLIAGNDLIVGGRVRRARLVGAAAASAAAIVFSLGLWSWFLVLRLPGLDLGA